jgi:hypothetical protein
MGLPSLSTIEDAISCCYFLIYLNIPDKIISNTIDCALCIKVFNHKLFYFIGQNVAAIYT